jgi:hypothetical protein
MTLADIHKAFEVLGTTAQLDEILKIKPKPKNQMQSRPISRRNQRRLALKDQAKKDVIQRAKREKESYLASIKRCNKIAREILDNAAKDVIINGNDSQAHD